MARYTHRRLRRDCRWQVAVDALAFYADPDTYFATVFMFDPPCGGFREDFSSDHGDTFYARPMPGKTARAALRKIAGVEHD